MGSSTYQWTDKVGTMSIVECYTIAGDMGGWISQIQRTGVIWCVHGHPRFKRPKCTAPYSDSLNGHERASREALLALAIRLGKPIQDDRILITEGEAASGNE